MEVHKTPGQGFPENVDEDAPMMELSHRNIPFEQLKNLEIKHKGIKLSKYYIADFLGIDKIIPEIEAMYGMVDAHISQALNYFTVTSLRLGLLINFGTGKIQTRRVIH